MFKLATDFHKERKAWFQIKHQIIGTYLPLFLGKVGAKNEKVFYIDGFAGQGLLDDGTEGSALIAAKCAAEPRQKSRQDILHCINIEADQETFLNLEKATQPYKHCVTNIFGDFNEQLPKILDLIGNSAAFFFIDPFGTKGVEISTLKELGERSGKTEVLVRYDDTRVKRLIMWAANNAANLEEKHRKVAAGFFNRVKELTDEEVAAKVQSELVAGTNIEMREYLIESYKSEVRRTAKFLFDLHYPIKNPATGGHRYYLVHFCKYVDGFTYMANFMAKAERTYQKIFCGETDMFGNPAKQQTFLEIDDHLSNDTEMMKITKIVSAIPRIIAKNRWQNSHVQLRDMLGEIVREFKWTTNRAEWLKALRQCQQAGVLTINGVEDHNKLHILQKV